MHIPDGYISPKVFIPFYLLFIPLLTRGIKKLRKQLDEKVLPLLSSLTALSFIVMMFNIPIPGGTSGHAIGTALIAIIFGPWAGFVAVSFVLLIQALLFGDGGITTYAINAMSMGFVASFSAYYIHKLLKNKISDKINYFFSGWASIVLASVVVAIVLGIEPAIAHDVNGNPEYFPFGLKVALTAIVGSHMLFFGVAEGIFTMFGVSYFKRYFETEHNFKSISVKNGNTDIFLFLLVVLLIFLLVPLGLITENPAWGEWDMNFFGHSLGFIPQGIKHFSAFYAAPLPDYSFHGVNAISSYYLSAIVAMFVITLVTYVLSKQKGAAFDKLFFVDYLLAVFAIVLSTNIYIILCFLVIALLLSGKDIFKLAGKAVIAILIFNLLTSVYFIFTKNYAALLVFNLRTFTILYLTLLIGKKLNIFAIFSFSPFISYVLSLAYSQIMNYLITYEQMKTAVESRTIVKIPLIKSYHILGLQIALFIRKSLENSKEITQAINSRTII